MGWPVIREELAAEFRKTPIGRLVLALDTAADDPENTGYKNVVPSHDAEIRTAIAGLCGYLRDALLEGTPDDPRRAP